MAARSDQTIRHLTHLGGAWVDPSLVIGIEAAYRPEDPAWAAVRVTLATGHAIFGQRSPASVARAVRYPDQEDAANEAREDSPERALRDGERRPQESPATLLRPAQFPEDSS